MAPNTQTKALFKISQKWYLKLKQSPGPSEVKEKPSKEQIQQNRTEQTNGRKALQIGLNVGFSGSNLE